MEIVYEEREEVHKVGYVTIDGKQFKYADLIGNLRGLDETDGFFSFWNIENFDQDIEKLFIDLKVATKGTRGSLYKSIPDYYEFFEKLCRMAGFGDDWWEWQGLDEDKFREWQGRKLQGKYDGA